MIAGDLIMQVPPNTLYWVGLRRVQRHVVQHDPMTPALHVLLQALALLRPVKARVVTDHMDHPVTPQAVPQIFQVAYKQRAVSRGPSVTHKAPVRQFIDPAT